MSKARPQPSVRLTDHDYCQKCVLDPLTLVVYAPNGLGSYDMVDEAVGKATEAALSRIVAEFAWLSDSALQRIANGDVSGYIGPGLAFALIEARRLVLQPRDSEVVEGSELRAA